MESHDETESLGGSTILGTVTGSSLNGKTCGNGGWKNCQHLKMNVKWDYSERSNMSVHVNSLVAYRQELDNFNEREKKIYGEIAFNGPMTDRECKDALFGAMADMNTARPRISDLIKKGWIVEVGKRKDRVTGKTVRIVKTVSPEERAEWQPGLLGGT